MQVDGRRVAGITDDGDHLAVAEGLAALDQVAEQGPADAEPHRIGGHVDGVLHRVTIGRPGAVGGGIGESLEHSVHLGDQIGQSTIEKDGAAPGYLGFVGRRLLETGKGMGDVMGIDGLDGGNVLMGGVANQGPLGSRRGGPGHAASCRATPAKPSMSRPILAPSSAKPSSRVTLSSFM